MEFDLPSANDEENEEAARPVQHPAAALQALFEAGHCEQTLTHGARALAHAPEDPFIHYFMALARLQLERARDARPHVDILLTRHPDWALSHHAAALYFKAAGRPIEARRHIENAIALDPGVSACHVLAAILALHRNDLRQARASVACARELDPEDPDVVRLAVEILGISQTTAREAWDRIRELEAALAVDPGNAGLHASIGFIHLDELDQPREAEQSFRTALLRDPAEREYQKALFRAVGQQRLLYRLLSIPQRAFSWLGNYFRGVRIQPWRLLFLLVGFKAVIAFVAWLLAVGIVFWPSCKIYEGLLIAEIQCVADASHRRLRWKRALNRWPFWARFGMCAVLILGSWLAVFAALGIVAAGFTALGIFAGVHFILTLALFLLRRARSRHGRWAAERRRKRQSVPPPLPS